MSDLSKLQKRTSAKDSVSATHISSVITKKYKWTQDLCTADKSRPVGDRQKYESDDLTSDSDDYREKRRDKRKTEVQHSESFKKIAALNYTGTLQ